jgi:hypothetical protein
MLKAPVEEVRETLPGVVIMQGDRFGLLAVPVVLVLVVALVVEERRSSEE